MKMKKLIYCFMSVALLSQVAAVPSFAAVKETRNVSSTASISQEVIFPGTGLVDKNGDPLYTGKLYYIECLNLEENLWEL